jgi:hypothetical protein
VACTRGGFSRADAWCARRSHRANTAIHPVSLLLARNISC